MIEKLDLRGKLCPEPVIATKKALDKTGTEQVEALVDDDICVANLERLARSMKASCHVTEEEGFFSVNIFKKGDHHQHQNAHVLPSKDKSVPDNNRAGLILFISRDQLGEGDPDFSRTLANVFLQTLFESGHKPRAILMANTGVKLMSAGSSTRKVLEDFRNAGTEVFACGLCVDFYSLKEEIAKEQITNMFAICEYLTAAEKIIQF